MKGRNLTFREAEQYGPREKTWRNWAYQGRIPVIRLGRRVYISEETILRMIEENTIPARKATR